MVRILKMIVAGLLAITIAEVSFGETYNHVLIFVSFSMPKASLKGWMAEAQKAHASLVIRGLYDHSFKATLQKVTEIANESQGGVQLDPGLFKRFQIREVPAVVVTHFDHVPQKSSAEEYDVIYGDVHLAYALTKIADQQDGLSLLAEDSLLLLRESRHV